MRHVRPLPALLLVLTWSPAAVAHHSVALYSSDTIELDIAAQPLQ